MAEDIEQLLMVVMCFLALCIFIWAYSDTVNRWREEAMWNYTVEWAAMNLQRCQFRTRNIQSGEVFVRACGLWKNQWASLSPEMETNVPSRGWKQFLAGKIEIKLSEINSLGTIQFSQHHKLTVVHYTIFMLIHVYIYHTFWICAYTAKI